MIKNLVSVSFVVLGCMACATMEEVSTDTRLSEAQEFFDEGKRLLEAGRDSEAVLMAEGALELREAALGGAHPDVAQCLSLLGILHTQQGDFERAEQTHLRALEIREAAFGEEHTDVAASINNLAILYKRRGQFTRAESFAQRGLAIWEKVLGGDHLRVAGSLHNLATLYIEQGHYSRAEPLLRRAVAIHEAALGVNHPDFASSLNNLASLYFQQGRYEEAESLLERALAIREAVLGESHPDVADANHNLGAVYLEFGHYARAEPLLQRALSIRQKILGENHFAVAEVLFNLGVLYESQGYYARAEVLYERSLAVREAIFGNEHPTVADTLEALADISIRHGAYARAELLNERALAIREAALGSHHPDVAASLLRLAFVSSRQGRYMSAEPLLRRALAISELALGSDHPHTARALYQLAGFYKSQGDHARAEPLYGRTIKVLEAAFGSKNPDVGDALQELAGLYMEQGDHARAEALYERALAIWEEALGNNHPNVAQVLQALARLRLAQDQLDEALSLFERAFKISDEHLRKDAFGFSEARLASALLLLRADEDRLYALARAYPDNARVKQLVLSTALLRKGRSVEEIAHTSRIIYRGLGDADRRIFERLSALRSQLAKLSFTSSDRSASPQHQERLKQLREKNDALEAELARRSAPLRALVSLPPPTELVKKVAAALPGDGALIELIAYQDGPLVPKPSSSPQGPREPRYLALILGADGGVHTIDLGPAEPIDKAALRLHTVLARKDVAYHAASRALYALVFRPLMPALGKVKRLFLSADGQLTLVPFDALHSGQRFLADDFEITYLTSGKDLLPRPEDIAPAQSVIVLADPDFGSLPPKRSSVEGALGPVERSGSLERFFSALRSEHADLPWPSLPGTRKEAEAIQRMLPQAQLLLGRAATKDALLKLSMPGVLHIATHGFFMEDASAPAESRGVGHFGAVGETGPVSSFPDPLLRSALVLAGARSAGAQLGLYPYEDSLVTALELSSLNLWGTQLVVLSACETGRGEVKIGQGVYGMRRALMVAGAETLVTSLWKVNDETTHQLMKSYYHNLLAGQGRAGALHSAMRTLRHKQPHPHFWAPFIAIGRNTPLQGLLLRGGGTAGTAR